MQLKRIVRWKLNDRWMSAESSYEMLPNAFRVNTSQMRAPNISSHTLVDLCGLNPWASPGKTLLRAFGFLEKEDIDPYQTLKGGIVEYFADQYLYELYGEDIDLESFTLTQFANFNQFPESIPFSGALDKLLRAPVKLPIEIKAKEMREWNKIVVNQQWPKDHLVQGMNQAYFVGASRFMMLYGFLTEEASLLLRKAVDTGLIAEIFGTDTFNIDYKALVETFGFTYEMFNFAHKIFEVNNKEIEGYRKKALDLYNNFFETRMIPKSYFKPDELAALARYKTVN